MNTPEPKTKHVTIAELEEHLDELAEEVHRTGIDIFVDDAGIVLVSPHKAYLAERLKEHDLENTIELGKINPTDIPN
jgi:cellobiose-specific phosphotransferase system component IIB